MDYRALVQKLGDRTNQNSQTSELILEHRTGHPTYMYTVNKLNYEPSADGKVLFDGVNNMPYDITPIFYQNGEEVELKEAGVYDLSMKISGTTYDGIYPTGLKVNVAFSTGINNVTLDSDASNCPIYNMNGQRVDGSYKGVVIQNGKKRLAK